MGHGAVVSSSRTAVGQVFEEEVNVKLTESDRSRAEARAAISRSPRSAKSLPPGTTVAAASSAVVGEIARTPIGGSSESLRLQAPAMRAGQAGNGTDRRKRVRE